MNKNFVFSIMMLMAFIFGLMVVGCDNGTTSKDTWSDITSLDQMDGKWRCTYTEKNISMKDLLEDAGMPLDPDMNTNVLKDIKVTIIADITLTIDASEQTFATLIKATGIFSGKNVGILWEVIKMQLESMEEVEGVTITIIDRTHSVIVNYNYPTSPIPNEYIEGITGSGLQINQSGTKIKIPADALEEGTPELIFYKQ